MTGRIFTSDHRTYDLPELLSWEVVHTGSVPCDSFSVTFLYDRSMAEALRLAAGFTAGLAADILFYSFSEWVMYAADPHIEALGSIQDWAGVYPVFHWSLIPWGFYLMLAVAFGFMLHVRKRSRQKYSEACRPLLGKHTDGVPGRLIDLLAVFALLAGTATTFSYSNGQKDHHGGDPSGDLRGVHLFAAARI